ncbi:MAG TPA: helix-turn-helix transcriptional regulator [Acidobacteriaceae bacterium]|jgi:transcriptional regulator with XRE-family HTH domain|nr:helix-turn-helix transcriptional regulator [Acidobacteriaceae bacterium]
MTDLKDAISKELKRAFREQKVSVSAAAKILSVSRQAVHSYLNGTSVPRSGRLALAVTTWNLSFSLGDVSFDKTSFPTPKLSSLPTQLTMANLFDSIKAEDLKVDIERRGEDFRISVSIKVA